MKAEQVQQCAELLVEFHKRFAPLFYEKRQAACAGKMIHGLVLDGVRANAAQIARTTPGADVRAMQHFVGISGWDHRPIIRELQAVVAQQLGDPQAVLICDETGFAKKGDKSVGVARQYSGTLGKVDNCQVGVFVAYVSKKGRTLVDEELYLPKGWIKDKTRRKQAEVPQDVRFRTKPEIALRIIKQAAEGPLPFGWVACDDLYGQSGDFRDGLDELGLFYVAEVPSTTKVWTQMPPLRQPGPSAGGRPRIRQSLSPDAPPPRKVRDLGGSSQQWQWIQVRQGTKKPIRSSWAALRVHPWRDGLPGTESWLLIERSAQGESKYYLSNAPLDTELCQLAEVAKNEWFVEQSLRDAKEQIGLDQFEVRKWQGWHHHMTMCMVAQAFLMLVRIKWKKGGLS